MGWNVVLKVRGQAEKLQRESVEEFNSAAENGDDKGRRDAHRKSKKADRLFERAANVAQRVNKITQIKSQKP